MRHKLRIGGAYRVEDSKLKYTGGTRAQQAGHIGLLLGEVGWGRHVALWRNRNEAKLHKNQMEDIIRTGTGTGLERSTRRCFTIARVQRKKRSSEQEFRESRVFPREFFLAAVESCKDLDRPNPAALPTLAGGDRQAHGAAFGSAT